MSSLELYRRHHAIVDVFAGRVVEHLDLVEHILARFIPRSIGPAPDPLALEQVEEALDHGIVLAIPTPAHGVSQIVVPQEARSLHAGELGALVRMEPAPCSAASVSRRPYEELEGRPHWSVGFARTSR